MGCRYLLLSDGFHAGMASHHTLPYNCHPQVVRCFENDDVIHVDGRVNPVEDIDTINFELALADIGQVEKR